MIYHIITPQQWQAAQKVGTYKPPSLENEGFIHFSKWEQVAATVERFYSAEPNLHILEVDEEKLQHSLIYERATDVADDFPHLYGALNLDAVVEVLDYPRQSYQL